ncbi:MAG: hypothetical protein OEZ02_02125 [Anaerolineae bacterium]|nr:hypothetical protein [Anaerolineae bacterium]
MTAQWYAIRSKPRKERVLYQQVRSRQIETFFPQIRVNPVNPRAARLQSYFPGYMFVRVDLDKAGLSTFQWMPYSYGLVSFDGEPAAVPDSLIASLKQRLKDIQAQGGMNFDGLEPGAAVRVTAGPFEGYEAIFDTRLPGEDRVRILLKIMSDRQLPVELQVGQIKVTKQD